MKGIYAVVTGGYETETLAVSHDEATAEDWAAALRQRGIDDARVEEIPLLEPGEPITKKRSVVLQQWLFDTGAEGEVSMADHEALEIEGWPQRGPSPPTVELKEGSQGRQLVIRGDDPEAVRSAQQEQLEAWRQGRRLAR